MTTAEKNINLARRAANRNAKAQQMTEEGYCYEATKTPNQFMVRTPEGRFHCCNIEACCCTCEDYKKHREPCKHVLWVKIERDEEEANMEAQCAEYDLRLAIEW